MMQRNTVGEPASLKACSYKETNLILLRPGLSIWFAAAR